MGRRRSALETTSELSAETRLRLVYDSETEIKRQWPAVAANVADDDLATYASGKGGDSVARCLRRGFVKVADAGLVVPDRRIITPPANGKIFEIPPITVDEGCDLKDLILQTMKDSDLNNDLFKSEVLDKFPPCQGLVHTIRPVLVTFGNIQDAEPAVIWGRSQGLPMSTVRTVFTIAREHPELNRELGVGWLWLASLEQALLGGDPRVPGAGWIDAARCAGLFWFRGWWSAYCWFAFSRECA